MRIRACSQLSTIAGRRVIMRCDFNVSLRGRRVADDYKIVRTLPTIRYLAGRGAERIILVSHLGRPGGRAVKDLSLKPVARRLQTLLGKKVVFVPQYASAEGRKVLENLPAGSIALLENIRFDEREKKNSAQLARELAKLGDMFINDALAVSHRPHASVARIQRYVPSYAGLLLEKELEALNALRQPRQPFVVVMGGAKLATKVKPIRALQKKAAHVLLGGMLVYPFLAARGWGAGKYRPDAREVKLARKLDSPRIVLPQDFVTSRRKDGGGEARVVPSDELPGNAYQFDIGPETIRRYAQLLKTAHSVLWNGPLGMFEHDRYRHGTFSVAQVVGSVYERANTVVGGGETITAVKQAGMLEYVGWASTGGGAMLAYLSGETMPGLQKIVRRW